MVTRLYELQNCLSEYLERLARRGGPRRLKLPPHLDLQLNEALVADPVVARPMFMPIRRGVAFVKNSGPVPRSELRPTARAVVVIPILTWGLPFRLPKRGAA